MCHSRPPARRDAFPCGDGHDEELSRVSVEPGDILLIRTGWLTWYRGLHTAGRREVATTIRSCGLRPGRDNARLLWDLHVAAVTADNPALEALPVAAFLTAEDRAPLTDGVGSPANAVAVR